MITVAELKKQRASFNQQFLDLLEREVSKANKEGKLTYRANLPDGIDEKFITDVLELAGFKVEHLKGDGGYGCLHENPYNYLNISWE